MDMTINGLRRMLLENSDGAPISTEGEGDNVNLLVSTKEQDSPFTDGFSRKRVSETAQRFDMEFLYTKNPELIDEIGNNASTAVHSTASRDVILTVGDVLSNTYRYLVTHFDIPYTAGNSQLIDITGTLNEADIANGVAQVFLRSNVTGSVVDTSINQADWNKSTVASVNWGYSQILQVDFQSLRVGRIRFMMNRGGVPVVVHEIVNDNLRKSGYWQTASLPPYWGINNDANYTYMEIGYGDTVNAVGFRYRVPRNAGAKIRCICVTVKSEGGQDLFDISGFNRSADNGITPITVSNVLIPILSIRVASTFNGVLNRMLAIPTGISLSVNNTMRYVILYRPALTNANFVAVDSVYSGMEYDVSATALSGGIQIDSDYVAASPTRAVFQQGILGKVILSAGRTGTSDILTVAGVRNSASNVTAQGVIRWREIR